MLNYSPICLAVIFVSIKFDSFPTILRNLYRKDEHYVFSIIRWFKFTLKAPYSIAHGKLRLAIWDTSFWTFWLKFGHKGP